MAFTDGVFNQYDLEAAKILDDFLPDRLFDAHAHLYDSAFAPIMCSGGCFAMKKVRHFEDYLEEMRPLIGDQREVRINFITTPCKSMKDRATGNREKSTAFLAAELEKHPGLVGEAMVMPGDTVEDVKAQLVHPRIRGFKCYHVLADSDVTWNCNIGEYLPETAWQVADEKGLYITLHMVKPHALSDPENLKYIIEMAKRYSNATLILAHAARGFASWTTVDTVEKLAKLENVWYDLAAVCESPAMFQIIKKTGTGRVMWGSDFPVSQICGKAISLADAFYWIGAKDLERFAGPTEFHSWLIATETFMAVRQACLMAELGRREIEDIFYNNAARLFDGK